MLLECMAYLGNSAGASLGIFNVRKLPFRSDVIVFIELPARRISSFSGLKVDTISILENLANFNSSFNG